jgi:hypothetical protein
MISIKRYSYLLETLSILTLACVIGDFIIKWSYLLGAYAKTPANFFTRIMDQQYAALSNPSLLAQHFSLSTLGTFLVDSISPLLLTAAIINFIRLLHYYRATKNIFSVDALARYKKVCRYALLWTIYNPINAMLTTLFITLSNPPGHRILEITLKSNDVVHAFFVGFFYFVARIMQEAISIKDEIDLTV